MFRYQVKAVCRATVEETWIVTAPHALNDDAVADAIYGDPAEGVTIECSDESVSDEEDRRVETIAPL